MVIFVVWLSFDCFWLWRMVHSTNRQKHSKPLVYQSSHVYTESAEYTKSASAVRIHRALCAYQQCCHLANGNKTCPSLLVFKNNNMSRGSHGFVRQSSRNSGVTCRATICVWRVRAWEQKVCGRGLKICQISSLSGPPCSLRMTRKKSK